MSTMIPSFLPALGKLDPLRSINSRIDPLMNAAGLYGKNAKTPWDPLAIQAGMYGTEQQKAASASPSAPTNTSALLTDQSTTPQAMQQRVAAGTPPSTSSTLFGQ
jgi:hypothetical protein